MNAIPEKFLEYLDWLDKKDDKIRAKLPDNIYYHDVKESYPYIPERYHRELFNLISFLKTPTKAKYSERFPSPVVLDVGAGTGRIVRMLIDNGIPAAGIEFHYPYVEWGRKVHKLSYNELIWKNAFDLDAEFLSGFNVIYTYMPLCNGFRMTELHFHLWKNSAPGTIFIEMYPLYYPMNMARIYNKNIENDFGLAFIKKASHGSYFD